MTPKCETTPTQLDEPSVASPAFVLLLAVTIVLPLVAAEIHTGEALGFDGAQALLWMGLVILLVFGATILEAAKRRELSLPRTGLLAGVALLAVGAGAAAVLAENRFAALLGATQLVLGVIYFVTVLLTLNSRARTRWLLAALVAAALASAAVSLVNRILVPPEVVMDYFEKNRLATLAEHDIAPGSPEEELYRIRIREDFLGTFFHANLMATWMAVGALLTTALLLGRLAAARVFSGGRGTPCGCPRNAGSARAAGGDPPTPRLRRAGQPPPYESHGPRRAPDVADGERASWLVAAIILVAAVAAEALALGLTKSRAGIAAAAVGLYLILVLGLVRRRSRRMVLLGAPLLVGLILLPALSADERFANALSSLRFRLDYWRASWDIIREHPWLGVGPDNFADYYLAHKLATAPEEIKNPHNVFVWAWAEMGLAGLLGLLALAVFGLRAAMRSTKCRASEIGDGKPLSLDGRGWTADLSAVASAKAEGGPGEGGGPRVHAGPHSLPGQSTKSQAAVLLPEAGERRTLGRLALALGLIYGAFQLARAEALDVSAILEALWVIALGLGFVLLGLLAARLIEGAGDERAPYGAELDRWLRCGLSAALLVFWLQNLVSIDFSQLPSVCIGYALLGLLVATGEGGPRFRWALDAGKRRFAALAIVALVIICYIGLIMRPVVGAVWAVSDVRNYTKTSETCRDGLRLAAERCPFWDEPYARLAESDLERSLAARRPEESAAHLQHGLDVLARGLEVNPRALRLRRLASRMWEDLARSRGWPRCSNSIVGWPRAAQADMDLAVTYGEQVAALAPTDAALRAELAALLARAGRPAAAAAEARKAIQLDDLMPDARRKLNPQTRAACQKLIDSLAAPRPTGND